MRMKRTSALDAHVAKRTHVATRMHVEDPSDVPAEGYEEVAGYYWMLLSS
jgi:hypothetical protein